MADYVKPTQEITAMKAIEIDKYTISNSITPIEEKIDTLSEKTNDKFKDLDESFINVNLKFTRFDKKIDHEIEETNKMILLNVTRIDNTINKNREMLSNSINNLIDNFEYFKGEVDSIFANNNRRIAKGEKTLADYKIKNDLLLKYMQILILINSILILTTVSILLYYINIY